LIYIKLFYNGISEKNIEKDVNNLFKLSQNIDNFTEVIDIVERIKTLIRWNIVDYSGRKDFK
jgi:hypothetical protein